MPEEGNVFIEVDFKTAELAVLAYCSGDEVLSDIIEQGRDLHAETACKAFRLPLQEELDAALAEFKVTGKMHRYKLWVESVKAGYGSLRDASKTITFGLCLAEGTPVLTSNGWKPIEMVSSGDTVWDGDTWVKHDGVVCTGEKQVIQVGDIWVTPEHEILTDAGWVQAQNLHGRKPQLSGEFLENGQLLLSKTPSSPVDANAGERKTSPAIQRATCFSVKAPNVEAAQPMIGTQQEYREYTPVSSLTSNCASRGSIAIRRWSRDAVARERCITRVMAAGASALERVSVRRKSISGILSRSKTGISRGPNSIASRITGITKSVTSGFSRVRKTCAIRDVCTGLNTTANGSASQISSPSIAQDTDRPAMYHGSCTQDIAQTGSLPNNPNATVRVYDIVNAGPNHRFQAGSLIVHNCYGRGAYALAREISKTGREMSVEDCQKIIDGFAKAYPKAWAWIQANKKSAVENEYVETAFGRRRYFQGISTMPEKEQQKATREASNSPIQGTVADLLAVAGVNLYRFRYQMELGKQIAFRVLLPIHDAFLIEVKAEYLAEMKKIIEICMSTLNKIPGTEKSIGTKIEVFRHRWGVEDDHFDEKKAA